MDTEGPLKLLLGLKRKMILKNRETIAARFTEVDVRYKNIGLQ